ncbi:YqzH family protein [Salsuginibacillus kocurii]|uniref:YqzH family protein n=1 Tax=Salsuginibacillus kocurii TaxID=427078 RepID=UPI000375EB49|nr:YqzH family protein [Salsuginibacillus kocurii]
MSADWTLSYMKEVYYSYSGEKEFPLTEEELLQLKNHIDERLRTETDTPEFEIIHDCIYAYFNGD